LADDTDPTGSVVRVTGSVATEEAWRDAIHSAVPSGLKTFLTWPDRQPQGPVVILVHGSLDRGPSFTRAIHRLDGSAVVTYDRRGYQGSRAMGPSEAFADHVDDLLRIADAADLGAGIVAIGHSFGGDIVQAAALERPERFLAIGAYEPPMPWLGFHRIGSGEWPALDPDPGVEAENFFRRMMGTAAWDRLQDGAKDDRRADGPALVQDLVAIRSLSFDPATLRIPVVFGVGGEKSIAHHREAVAHLGETVATATTMTIDDAGHGAHVSHPDHFATLIERVLDRATTEGQPT
jgi:pimeloyl-ACP methyl ester carboxylesterase